MAGVWGAMLHIWCVGGHASHLACGGTCFTSGTCGDMLHVWHVGGHASHLAWGEHASRLTWDVQQALASSLCPPNYAVTKPSH